MYVILSGSLLNIVLDPIFLFGLEMGMRGAALATVIAQFVSAVWAFSYFARGKSLLKLRVSNLRLKPSICLSVIAVGSPMFAMQMAASVVNAILNTQLRICGGDLAISVIGAVHAVALFFVMPIFGLTQGAQPIIGFNYGAHMYERVRKAMQTGILSATVLCVVGFVTVMLFPSQVIRLFNRHDQDMLHMGVHAMRVCLVMLPAVGYQIVAASYFQAVGKPFHALFLGLSRRVLFLTPAILLLPRFLGLEGIWIAIPIADLLSFLLTGVWFWYEMRNLDRKGRD
jgi:Na+-driven multidrug efflux pump